MRKKGVANKPMKIFLPFSPPSISTNDRIAMVLSNPSAS